MHVQQTGSATSPLRLPVYLVLVTDRTDPGLLKARLTDLARSRPSVASAVILHEEDLAGSSISDAAVAEFL